MADDAELAAFPGLTPTDRENLAGGDKNFKPHNWEDLKKIIGNVHVYLPLNKPIWSHHLHLPRSRQQSRNPKTQTLRSTTLYQMDQSNQSYVRLHHCLRSQRATTMGQFVEVK